MGGTVAAALSAEEGVGASLLPSVALGRGEREAVEVPVPGASCREAEGEEEMEPVAVPDSVTEGEGLAVGDREDTEVSLGEWEALGE